MWQILSACALLPPYESREVKDAHTQCELYLGCVEHVEPATLGGLLEAYGEKGHCWKGSKDEKLQCGRACEEALDQLAEGAKGIAACNPHDPQECGEEPATEAFFKTQYTERIKAETWTCPDEFVYTISWEDVGSCDFDPNPACSCLDPSGWTCEGQGDESSLEIPTECTEVYDCFDNVTEGSFLAAEDLVFDAEGCEVWWPYSIRLTLSDIERDAFGIEIQDMNSGESLAFDCGWWSHQDNGFSCDALEVEDGEYKPLIFQIYAAALGSDAETLDLVLDVTRPSCEQSALVFYEMYGDFAVSR